MDPLPSRASLDARHAYLLERRTLLLGALGLWLAGCASTPTPADTLEEVTERLEERLATMATDEAEAVRFRELVGRIREDAERFLRQHEDFTRTLVSDSRDRAVGAAELRTFVLDSARERRDLRGRILSHQEELKLGLGESRWLEVVGGLNDAEAMGRVVGRRL
jgi:hypothetical protein